MIKKFSGIDNVLVFGHKSPDADSICAGLAIVKHLVDSGKNAKIFLQESCLENLKWLEEENSDLFLYDNNLNSFYYENIVVVDCEPTKERTNFNFKNLNKNINIFNIDHHSYRIKVINNIENNAEDGKCFNGVYNSDGLIVNTYIKDSPSTCSILIDDFGIYYDFLILGVYYDSLSFNIKTVECVNSISNLNHKLNSLYKHRENRIDLLLKKSRYIGDKKSWDKINKLKTWWSDDEKVCFLYDPSYSKDSRHIIGIMNGYAPTVVFFYKNGNVSLKTQDVETIDLSKFCLKFGGGGHSGAGGLRMNKNMSIKEIANHIKWYYSNSDDKNFNANILSDCEEKSIENFERDLKKVLTINKKKKGK